MKKGKYQIMIRTDGEIGLSTVNGWIIPDEKSGLTFGARFRAGRWEITELSTGLLITDSAEAHTVKNKILIPHYIEKMRDVITGILKQHHEYIEKFEKLKEDML